MADYSQIWQQPPAPPAPMAGVDIIVQADGTDAPVLDPKTGVLRIPHEDGDVTFDFAPQQQEASEKHEQNLAEVLGESELDKIASELIEGIDSDIQSRAEWMEMLAKGIELLQLKIEKSRGDAGSSGAALEGMSVVGHPLLLEACLRFQANFQGEMLPATGPVKVSSYGKETKQTDDFAEALQEDMNYYLTQVATEYYPDTTRMAFQYGFCGHGIKKVYPCPLRRRPVSESVDMKDFVVSNSATDLQNAERVTHIINMSKGTMKRMQLLGAYRDVDLHDPTPQPLDRVTEKVAQTEGRRARSDRWQDNQHQLYECYCNLDLFGFEHKQDGEITGLPLPYRVVIDVSSRKVLAIHRDWDEDDEDLFRREIFVEYVYAPTLSYYGTGLLHILGNTTYAARGAWRLFIDALMFANFPGFLYLKNGSKQINNTFRVPPGGGAPIDAPAGTDIRQSIMPLPYKAPDPASIQFIEQVIATGQRLGSIAEIQVGEGRQDAPVGTTLAMIEQATKVIDAVHKRAHTSQSKEFNLLRDLFRQNPEALMRARKRNRKRLSQVDWTAEQLVDALENYDLVPVADPNTPTHLHRVAKGVVLKGLQQASPQLYDAKAVDKRVASYAHIDDLDSLFSPPLPPGAAGPSPQMLDSQSKQIMANAKLMDSQTNAAKAMADAQQRDAERHSKEKIEAMRVAITAGTHPTSVPLINQELGILEPGMGF
jgi:hypothetical protein